MDKWEIRKEREDLEDRIDSYLDQLYAEVESKQKSAFEVIK